EIGAHGIVAGPDNSLQEQPANAILKALEKAGKTVADVDLFELNEAFAAVGIASTAALGIDPGKVNVNGGAIALGHPIGASADRLARCRQVHLHQRAGDRLPAARAPGGGARRRPLLAVLRRGAARRPRADAGPRHRRRGLHPVDGLTWAPGWAVLGDSAGTAG